MENRDRDKVSKGDAPTDAGDVNREVESRRGQGQHGSGVGFGGKIGEGENLEPKTRDDGNTGTQNHGSSDRVKSSNPSGRSEGNH
ncbi:MAG: hypothetical protein NVSMB68_05820 [Thermoanaerobaculia bacterium]